MEQPTPVEPRHTSSEVANYYACQKLVKTWHDKGVMSAQAIPIIHGELMKGVEGYQKKGLVPLSPGQYRTTGVSLEGKPADFFVPTEDVGSRMTQYSRDLDGLLGREPVSPATKLEETVHGAAWAYYTFIRIHPFLDGNGRVGRMILRRVMMGRGYKDIIFQPGGAEGKKRDAHIAAMDATNNSGNLAHLELYLLRQLRFRYSEDRDNAFLAKIDDLMEAKKREIDYQTERRDLTEIWDGFKGLQMFNVKEDQYKPTAA